MEPSSDNGNLVADGDEISARSQWVFTSPFSAKFVERIFNSYARLSVIQSVCKYVFGKFVGGFYFFRFKNAMLLAVNYCWSTTTTLLAKIMDTPIGFVNIMRVLS